MATNTELRNVKSDLKESIGRLLSVSLTISPLWGMAAAPQITYGCTPHGRLLNLTCRYSTTAITDSGKLIKLSPFARDAAFQEDARPDNGGVFTRLPGVPGRKNHTRCGICK